jgi:hypothetical protein
VSTQVRVGVPSVLRSFGLPWRVRINDQEARIDVPVEVAPGQTRISLFAELVGSGVVGYVEFNCTLNLPPESRTGVLGAP